jgi:hypothetical protein
MTIFTVQTTLKHDNGSLKYMYVETQHTGVADFVADLKQGPVVCRKIHASFDRINNTMVVLESKDFAIAATIVGSVEMQTLQFVEQKATAKVAA